MLRVIKDLRPAWIVGENVAGIINMALDTSLVDLESEGYETRAFVLPACGIEAPHQRYRVAIVAHANDAGLQGRHSAELPECSGKRAVGPVGTFVANVERSEWRPQEPAMSVTGDDWRATQPGLGGNPDGFSHRLDGLRWPAPFGCEQFDWEPPRTVKGMKHRVDRLKCLGNAVVPQQFYPIFAAIAEIERGAL